MKINRNNLYQHLIEKQFNLIEKVTFDAFIEDWKNWEITQKQHTEFKKYFISLSKKVLKISKKKALIAYEYFELNHGLKVKL